MDMQNYQTIEALTLQLRGDFSEHDAEIYKRIKELKDQEIKKPESSSFECFGCGS